MGVKMGVKMEVKWKGEYLEYILYEMYDIVYIFL